MYKIGKNFVGVDLLTSEMITKMGYKPSYSKKSNTLTYNLTNLKKVCQYIIIDKKLNINKILLTLDEYKKSKPKKERKIDALKNTLNKYNKIKKQLLNIIEEIKDNTCGVVVNSVDCAVNKNADCIELNLNHQLEINKSVYFEVINVEIINRKFIEKTVINKQFNGLMIEYKNFISTVPYIADKINVNSVDCVYLNLDNCCINRLIVKKNIINHGFNGLMIEYEDKNSIEYNDKELYYQNAKNIRINKNHGKNDTNIKHKGNDEEFKFETNKFEIINLYIQYYTWNVLINFNKHDILYNYLNNIFDYDLYKFHLIIQVTLI
jgi:hypothetical protein